MAARKYSTAPAGKRHGRLTVIGYSHVEHKTRRATGGSRWVDYWRCVCDCGKETILQGRSFTVTRSCGCLVADTRRTIHGHCRNDQSTGEYRSWVGMKTRCENTNSTEYPDYGGRGITICNRWRNSFENFLADMGTKPSPRHSIDRFPNNNGNYEPSNCRWATQEQQNNNRRNTRFLTLKGETLSVRQWSRKIGMDSRTLTERLNHGWSVQRALTQPLVKRR